MVAKKSPQSSRQIDAFLGNSEALAFFPSLGIDWLSLGCPAGRWDSDDHLGIMWGDGGMIYFWVRERDARAGDFSDTWLVLQCA